MEYASLQRGLQILHLVQEKGRASATDISRELDVPLSTVYRYIAVLRESGFAIEVDGTLVPSERLAEGWSDISHLVRLANPILHALRTEMGMTSILAVRVHTVALCLAVAYAHPQHRISFRRGQMRSLHAGATALPLLAHAPDSIVKEVLSRGYRGYTAATLSPAQLAHELERVRTNAFAVSLGQTTAGMMGIGVPVIVNGACVASLSLVDEINTKHGTEEEIVAALKAAAADLGRKIARGEDADYGPSPWTSTTSTNL